MQQGLTKKLKRELRELNGLAWKREVEAELGRLDDAFSSWKDGEMDPFDLVERIHRFHDGDNRELYKSYAMARGNEAIAVSAAIAGGVIKRDEVSEALLANLEPRVRSIQESRADLDPATGDGG